VLAWLWVIKAYQDLGRELPVHLRCIFEGMEETGGASTLPELCANISGPGGFLDKSVVDACIVSDNYYVGKMPCITHALRGCSAFALTVQGSTKDLHSGVMGGAVHEAMTDLVYLLSSLVDSSGKILVDEIYDDVAPLTPSEIDSYLRIDLDLETLKEDAGVKDVSDALLHHTQSDILMARWRYPTLSLHGIEGAFAEPGIKTVIPAKVTAKFSIRLVPNMKPEKVEALVRRHLDKVHRQLKSPNMMELSVLGVAWPWYRDPRGAAFEAAKEATKRLRSFTNRWLRRRCTRAERKN